MFLLAGGLFLPASSAQSLQWPGHGSLWPRGCGHWVTQLQLCRGLRAVREVKLMIPMFVGARDCNVGGRAEIMMAEV